MSIEIIHLKKLLQLFYSPQNIKTTLLRADIRLGLKKVDGTAGDGGDFHVPFWADAKDHALGRGDLRVATRLRVAEHRGRVRLYPELAEGFLIWWDEKRRWHNEPLLPFEGTPHARMPIAGLGVVKIENLLCVRSAEGFQRLVYPYFSEKPVLPDEGGRLGLWALQQSLNTYALDDMRILDVLRARTFTAGDYPLEGNEAEIFSRRYQGILDQWNTLKREYR